MSKNTETRRNEIYSLLVSSGKVKVKELAQLFPRNNGDDT